MAQLLQTTLEVLLTRVRRWLREPTESKSHWDDLKLRQFLNSNYRLRCAELHLAFEGYFILVGQRDIVANQARYSWPPNFQKLSKIEIVRVDGTRQPLQRYERRQEQSYSATGGAGDGYYPYYRVIGEGLELEPTPSSTVTNGLRLEYFGIPTELTEPSDQLNSDFPALFDELLVLDTAASALMNEVLMESSGNLRVIEMERARWVDKWERYIENRILSQSRIIPWTPHYEDS